MNTLEDKIREFNREILRLKTACPMVSAMKTFWSEYTFTLEAVSPAKYKSYYYEITYIDGTQPILTDLAPSYGTTTWLGMAVLESPSNNKQILVLWSTGYGETVDFTISSSRQILGIRKISAP